MIRIGNGDFGKKPGVAAVIDAIMPMNSLLRLKQEGLDIFEVRVDLIDQHVLKIAEFLRELRERVELPVIGTIRENDNNRANRLELFREIVPFVDCVDIEFGSKISDEVKRIAQGKTILVSEHDFKKTPEDDVLAMIVDAAVEQGAQIVKLVTMAETAADAWRLLEFTRRCRVPMVAFAMGENGSFSRVKACEYGSLFTYGYITKPVAPGQLSALELIKRVKKK
ncbi:MAG: type I 3-dehydroquinate dehydratase [Chitinispirillaceae bacterium]|jgi:3-dehydroquinate dehydratase-1|nr:type I 3-dehydroquinate dehydratase [Chitinispirillaceae bacterium]